MKAEEEEEVSSRGLPPLIKGSLSHLGSFPNFARLLIHSELLRQAEGGPSSDAECEIRGRGRHELVN